jgi:hypothetical protein
MILINKLARYNNREITQQLSLKKCEATKPLNSISNSTLDTSIAEELFSQDRFRQSEFAKLISKRKS